MKVSIDRHLLRDMYGICQVVGWSIISDGVREKCREITDLLWNILKDTENNDTILKRIERLEDHASSFPYIEPSVITNGLAQEYDNKHAMKDLLDVLIKFSEVDGVTIKDGFITYSGSDLTRDKMKLLTLTQGASIIKERLK